MTEERRAPTAPGSEVDGKKVREVVPVHGIRRRLADTRLAMSQSRYGGHFISVAVIYRPCSVLAMMVS